MRRMTGTNRKRAGKLGEQGDENKWLAGYMSDRIQYKPTRQAKQESKIGKRKKHRIINAYYLFIYLFIVYREKGKERKEKAIISVNHNKKNTVNHC